MKKALSIILCLVMIAAVAVSAISAEETKLIDGRELQQYGQLHYYLGAPLEQSQIPDVTDGKVVTGTSAGCAVPFGLALIAVLKGQEEADRIAKQIVIR